MSDQTTMNNRPMQESPAAGVGRNLAGLTHDLLTLSELQCRLIAVDVREAKSRCLGPIMLMAGAMLLALGTMPVILLGIGWTLVNRAGFSEPAAFLTVSLIALGVAGGAGWWGWTRMESSLTILKRSQRELAENVRWVRQALLKQKTHAEGCRQ